MNQATRDFIQQHAGDDIRRLALKGRAPDVDMPLALEQIAGRQTARHKLPSWAAVDGIVYPPRLSMEQCSSERTARYKQQLVETWLQRSGAANATLVDLTGGFGVDFSFMSRPFRHRVYVEQQSQLCAISSANFDLFGLSAEVVCCDAAQYLSGMQSAAVVYLDPARRNAQGGRTYSIADCTPNVAELLPTLRRKATVAVVVKLSPMLDWHKAVADLPGTCEVHIVSVGNECKELLLVVAPAAHDPVAPDGETAESGADMAENVKVVCVNDDDVFEFCASKNSDFIDHFAPFSTDTPAPSTDTPAPSTGTPAPSSDTPTPFLFEPNASIMKAGCFAAIEQRYGVAALAPNSHLFVGATDIPAFPGRRFRIAAAVSPNKRELKAALQGIARANVAVRNYPLSAAELQRRLKLKDGGDHYLFATTLADGRHRLLICTKIK